MILSVHHLEFNLLCWLPFVLFCVVCHAGQGLLLCFILAHLIINDRIAR